eukprot:3900169-Pleurochrysis_carterae.AAC.5
MCALGVEARRGGRGREGNEPWKGGMSEYVNEKGKVNEGEMEERGRWGGVLKLQGIARGPETIRAVLRQHLAPPVESKHSFHRNPYETAPGSQPQPGSRVILNEFIPCSSCRVRRARAERHRALRLPRLPPASRYYSFDSTSTSVGAAAAAHRRHARRRSQRLTRTSEPRAVRARMQTAYSGRASQPATPTNPCATVRGGSFSACARTRASCASTCARACTHNRTHTRAQPRTLARTTAQTRAYNHARASSRAFTVTCALIDANGNAFGAFSH